MPFDRWDPTNFSSVFRINFWVISNNVLSESGPRWTLSLPLTSNPGSGPLADDSIFVVHSRRLSQGIGRWRSRSCDGSTLFLQIDFVFSQSISRCVSVDLLSLSISRCQNECFHCDATLENSMLRFHAHFAQSISRSLNDPNFAFPFLNSLGCMIHPNPASKTDSLFLIPNSTLASISRPQVLLLVFFPASAYSTWFCF